MNQWKLLYRGTFLLLAVTLCGLWTAQGQLTQLTQRQEAPLFSVASPKRGSYEIVWLGDSYDWRQAYEVGTLWSDRDFLYLGDGTKNFRLPLQYGFFLQPLYVEMNELIASLSLP
ncbi:MAG: hypothetical protein E6713_17355 [Sporomusaceae bacterium]|nr:hypothetical protein [Sporomusaceae bacterium]